MRFLILEITTILSICQSLNQEIVILSDCNGPGLTECTVTLSDSCNTTCSLVNLGGCNTGWSWLSEREFTCEYITADCPDEALRLVGGSTDREGRVEVCVGGRRWRTVCTGSQELAKDVCSQMGYVESNGGSMTLLLIPLATYLQEAQWQHSTHFLLEHFQSTD